jgi:hypothetical protein
MKKIIYLLILMLLMLAFSCSKENPVQNNSTNEIFPLKIGNKWTFKTTSNSIVSTHINEVKADTLIQNEIWYILTYDTNIVTICRNKSDGWWFVAESNGSSVINWKYPAKVNDEYMTYDSTLVKITSINEQITVPAGTFNCYHYYMIHYKEGYTCDEYLSPGVGLIKHVVYYDTTASLVNETTELFSNNLK